MNSNLKTSSAQESKRFFYFFMIAFVLYAMAFTAEAGLGGGDAQEKIVGFFGNIKSILDAISIVVVTIAIIFAGYQIAFANKRIADVAPILIGGVLIGAATQIAKLLIDG